MNPYHNMLSPSDSIPPYFNVPHPGNLPSPSPYMYTTMSSHRSMDPYEKISYPDDPSSLSKDLTRPVQLTDPME